MQCFKFENGSRAINTRESRRQSLYAQNDSKDAQDLRRAGSRGYQDQYKPHDYASGAGRIVSGRRT